MTQPHHGTATDEAAGSQRPRRARVSPDRLSVSPARLVVMTLLVGVMLWAALTSLPSDRSAEGRVDVAAYAAALSAVLAIFGLRSVPVRWIVRGLALLSGALLARFGELGALDGITGSWRVLVWLGALGGALVLAPSSRTVPGVDVGTVVRADHTPPPRTTASDPRATTASGRRLRARAGVPAALIVAAVALVGASSLLLGPRIANRFPVGPSAGDLADFGDNRGDNALVARDTLDMTTRPRLSEEIVMTVRSSIVTFWRAETFDVWDRSTWTRSEGGGSAVVGGRVVPAPDDLAAVQGETSEQEFRLETGYATAVPAPASPVEVEMADEVAQRPDGTLWSPGRPLGSGTTYSVQSRQVRADEDALRRAGSARDAAEDGDDLAAEVLDRYAQSPDTTDRVRQLAQDATAGATNDLDRIQALERWMDQNTTYSTDAPLAPEGVDVVDDFLFTTRQGWCEQIASSLVVMARAVGVPARLATGFAPGEWDAVNGRFVVRERDAHAWAEVWFPDAGWVPFDPTAGVPLAGTEEATAGADARDWREIGGLLLLVVGLCALAAGPVRRLVRRLARRWSGRRVHRAAVRRRWDASAEERLEHVGEQAGRRRRPAETVTTYAAAVAEVVEDERLRRVGVLVDRARYGPHVDPADPDGGSRDAGTVDARTEDARFVDEVLSSH